jgi:prepilin-type N-terminal cleavage/methylation domain-containing protein
LRDSFRAGFTLIELMIVAAIIAILAMIALPKFADMVRKAKEASLRGDLGMMRSCLTIYYSDNEGLYPNITGNFSTIRTMFLGKYASSFPLRVNIPATPHPAVNSSSANHVLTDVSGACNFNFSVGGWDDAVSFVYAGCNRVANGAVVRATFFLSCRHTDMRGTSWTTQ